MFDKVNLTIGGGSKAVPYCKEVREIKAPTDESIKLLKEMQEKTIDSILLNQKFDLNGFNCRVVVFKTPLDYDYICRVLYDLNGKEKKFECEIPQNEKDNLGVEIIKKFSKHLAIELLVPDLVNALKQVMI